MGIEYSHSGNTETVCIMLFGRRSTYPYVIDVASVSGTGGAILRLFDVSTGNLLSEQLLHRAEAGRLTEPDIAGLSFAFDSDASSVYVLTNAHEVRRVNTKTGEVQWGWSAPDQL